VALGKVLP